MPADQNKLFKKVASYIEATQGRIDHDNERRIMFVKRATQAAGVLAHRGIIPLSSVDDFVDKVAGDHTSVWDVVEKLAANVAPDNLGSVTMHKVASGASVDPFERVFFGVGNTTPGMID